MATPEIPEDIVNRALDECGVAEIGDLQEGTTQANAALRIYWPTLRQLLSGAEWNFARAEQTLNLLASLNDLTVSNVQPPSPWQFMYEWPVDCVHARWIPNTNPGGVIAYRSPAKFLVGSFPIPAQGAWEETEGHDPEQTRCIVTNVQQATLIYTKLMQYPNSWDPLFEQAMVALLAARLAMPCIPDKKLAQVIRSDNLRIAAECLGVARARDGNEGWTVNDHTPDWIRSRTSYSTYWDGFSTGWCSVPGVEDAGGVY
jgi:hypothetical protein